MEFTVLAVGGYTLMFFNLITLIILLKKLHPWINTSFYVLSISDILYSILVASILLINHTEMTTNTDYGIHKINTSAASNIFWNIMDESGSDHGTVSGYSTNNYYPATQRNFNITLPCNVMNIIMEYAMFLVPLTNSFVSLLIFSVQCNLNIHCLKKQCIQLAQSHIRSNKIGDKYIDDTNNTEDDMDVSNTEIAKLGSEICVFEAQSKLKKGQNSRLKFLQTLKFDGLQKNNKKILTVFLISQWIIPVIITGVLYFAEYNNADYKEEIEGRQCPLENIFSFDNCRNNSNDSHMIQDISSATNIIIVHDDYLNNQDLTRVSNPNNTQVNNIISKVQNIVNSLLNNKSDSLNHTRPISFYNHFELQNITNHIRPGLDFNYTQKNNSEIKYESTSTEANIYVSPTHLTSNKTIVNLENTTDIPKTEPLFFNNILWNASHEMNIKYNDSMNNKYKENVLGSLESPYKKETSTSLSNIKQPTTERSKTTVESITVSMTTNQIYADIIKRIHNITTQSRLKNGYKFGTDQNKKQSKQANIEEKLKSSTNFSGNIPLSLPDTIKQDNYTECATGVCISKKCLLSAKFIKVYILILVLLIYFLPILLCFTLQVRGKLLCRLILTKLEGRLKAMFDTTTEYDIEDINESNSNIIRNIKEIPGPSNWFPEHKTENTCEESNDNTDSFQQVTTNKDNNMKESKEGSEAYKNVYDKKEKLIEITKKVQKNEKLLDVTKMSLLCGILLWTPVFLELLLKILVCLHVPEWLMDVTYFSAIAFNVVRNAFNFSAIKLQEIGANNAKINSVHPT